MSSCSHPGRPIDPIRVNAGLHGHTAHALCLRHYASTLNQDRHNRTVINVIM